MVESELSREFSVGPHGNRRSRANLEPASRSLGALVGAALSVAPDALSDRGRGPARLAFARQIAMYLAHTQLGLSFTAAGQLFGRDRTTARHACRQVEDRREDPRVDSMLDCLERAIGLSADFVSYRRSGAGHAA